MRFLAIVLFVAGSALAMTWIGSAPNPIDVAVPAVSEQMQDAAVAFLSTLEGEARSTATYGFDDEERYNFHFIPRERNGLPLRDMSPEQRTAAHALMQVALSSSGYLKATSVMALEGVLRDIEGSQRRDPEGYFFTVFGDPAGADPWGWRVEGHHLSINFTSVTGQTVATTPAFLGTNPARVGAGPVTGWRVLAAEEDLGYAMLAALDDAQRQRAIIAEEAPRDIITGANREASLEAMEGLPASEMTASQRALLMRIVREYTHNANHEIADARMARIEQAGLERLHFAWAGSDALGEGHYYRVHGPTVLIEFDNVQGGANHVHSVWRDLEDDFGGDLLRQHYEQADHHQEG